MLSGGTGGGRPPSRLGRYLTTARGKTGRQGDPSTATRGTRTNFPNRAPREDAMGRRTSEKRLRRHQGLEKRRSSAYRLNQ
jgi:hypothetical protein